MIFETRSFTERCLILRARYEFYFFLKDVLCWRVFFFSRPSWNAIYIVVSSPWDFACLMSILATLIRTKVCSLLYHIKVSMPVKRLLFIAFLLFAVFPVFPLRGQRGRFFAAELIVFPNRNFIKVDRAELTNHCLSGHISLLVLYSTKKEFWLLRSRSIVLDLVSQRLYSTKSIQVVTGTLTKADFQPDRLTYKSRLDQTWSDQ